MKRTLLFLMALIMSAGFVFAQTTIPASNNVPGLHFATSAVDQFTGVTIDLGNDASVWPWSTAGDDGAVAFTPVAGATYHMTFNVTSVDDGNAASGFRVRWFKDNAYDNHTAQDAVEVNNHVFTADQTADFIPAYFQNTITVGNTQTYTVDFTMDGSQPADGLVGNLGIRGQQGATGFVINTIVITDDAGNQLVNYDKDAKTVLPPSSDVPGLHFATAAVDQFTGVTIDLGNDASVWPWSTAGDDGAVAFTPVADATYHMTFNVTSVDDGNAASGFRVRWFKDNAYDNHTAQDAVEVNNHVFTADQTADFVPAYFQNTITVGNTQTYTVDFTMDGSQPADGLVGNLGIRGQQGATGFVINTLVITDDAGNQLVNYAREGWTGIIPVKSAVSNAYGVTGGIKVNGINENVSIYSIDGSLVKQAIANQGTTIPVQQGLYIVKVGANNAVKVLVK